MFQGRTNIGQLVSQLSLSEKYGSGRTMGTSQVLIYVSISVLLSLLGEWRGFEMQFLKQYLLGLCYEWEVFWLVPGGVCRMLTQLCHVLWLCVCGLPGVFELPARWGVSVDCEVWVLMDGRIECCWYKLYKLWNGRFHLWDQERFRGISTYIYI